MVFLLEQVTLLWHCPVFKSDLFNSARELDSKKKKYIGGKKMAVKRNVDVGLFKKQKDIW